jgi:cytochrome c-type biogenesis protein CcmE
MRNAVKVAITGAVALIGGAFLFYSSVSHHVEVDELVLGGLDGWGDKELKIHGYVVPNSIIETVIDQQIQRTFVLHENGKKIRVFHQGPKPDTFKDRAEVIATGRLVRAHSKRPLADSMCKAREVIPANCPVHLDGEPGWVLDATDLMAKCPSRYSDR